MRNIVYLFASVGLLCLGTSCAKRSEPADALSGTSALASTVTGDRGVVLAYDDAIPMAVIERIEKYAERNLPVPVHTILTDAKGTTPTELAKVVSSLRRDEDVCVIAIVTGLDKAGEHGHVSVETKSAVLSYDALAAVVKVGDADNLEEQLLRCLEKETLHSVGLMAGAKSCVNPLCCMSTYENREQLMMKGRNYGPPCGMKVSDLISGK